MFPTTTVQGPCSPRKPGPLEEDTTMATTKKKAPTNRAAAATPSKKKAAKKAGKKKGSKKVARARKEEEPEDDAIQTDDEDDDADETDEDEDEEDDDADEDDDDGDGDDAGDGSTPPVERDKSPIAKRMAKRLVKALSGLRKRHATISEWREASDISTDLAAGISSIEDAIAKLNEKPDNYKPKDRRPRAKHEFKEGDRVKVSGKKSRELYLDIFGEDGLDNLKIVRVKGKHVVVEHDGHKQALPLSSLAPAEAS